MLPGSVQLLQLVLLLLEYSTLRGNVKLCFSTVAAEELQTKDSGSGGGGREEAPIAS